MGMLGKDGKAMSCSSRTWSLRFMDFVSMHLRVDTLGRGDTTDGDETSFGTPAPSARPARAMYDFGCLPSEVEAVVRSFLGWGSLHSSMLSSAVLLVMVTLVCAIVAAATSEVGSPDVSWWAMSAKIPDRKADPYDDRNGWFLGVMRAADLLRNSWEEASLAMALVAWWRSRGLTGVASLLLPLSESILCRAYSMLAAMVRTATLDEAPGQMLPEQQPSFWAVVVVVYSAVALD